MFSWLLSTSLANTFSAIHRRNTRSAPADSVRARNAALPSRMVFAAYELRLPFGHTGATAKEPVTVKVACGAAELFTAPLADFYDAILSRKVWFAFLTFNAASERAVDLIQSAAACRFFAALFAYRPFVNAPPSLQKTLTRAVQVIRSASLWTKGVIASFTISHFLCSHIAIISHFIEIERKYCDIAIERLRQQAFSFEAAL